MVNQYGRVKVQLSDLNAEELLFCTKAHDQAGAIGRKESLESLAIVVVERVELATFLFEQLNIGSQFNPAVKREGVSGPLLDRRNPDALFK